MDWENFLYGLKLKNQDVINQKVESQRFLENETFVLQFNPQLSYIWNLTKLALPAKTLL